MSITMTPLRGVTHGSPLTAFSQKSQERRFVTNIVQGKPSRKKLHEGDLFSFDLVNGTKVYGRVISTSAVVGSTGGWNLIYIYDPRKVGRDGVPNRSELSPENLLIPPDTINRLGWSRGYFTTIGNVPLDQSQLLPRHVFKTHRGHFVNEAGEPTAAPRDGEPAQFSGVGNYRTIDDSVSEALGIPLAPD
jgi:hypothetical protein